MTDELTPEQEADIRRLLAEARHDEPIPADVAARLDSVLGDLSVDDLEPDHAVETAEPATVTELAGVRHRRRNAGRLLLAAAAVVVGGVAMGQVLGNTSGDDDAQTSADAGSAADVPPERAEPQNAPGDSTGDAGGFSNDDGEESAEQPNAAASDALSDQSLLTQLRAPLSLTPDNFATEVEANLRDESTARTAAAARDFDGVQLYSATSLFTCADADYGVGARLPAFYDEQEAVLVLRRPTAGSQRVDLLACGTGATLDSIELPAP